LSRPLLETGAWRISEKLQKSVRCPGFVVVVVVVVVVAVKTGEDGFGRTACLQEILEILWQGV
jgi:hypothetical protein